VSVVQVGRFMVRPRLVGEICVSQADGVVREHRAYVIRHIPTDSWVCDLDTFADAMIVADDLSRFSLHDPCSRDRAKAAAQVGDEVQRWCTQVRRTGVAMSFREWRAKHS
jgi:hypothetical protein